MKLNQLLVILPVLCGITITLSAQNTIGGQKKEVSQEEVMRQTAFLDAEKERMLGKYDNAIASYRNFLYNNETYDAAWYGLARCYAEKKGYGTALETINKAIEYNPGNKWYYLFKADIFEKNGQHAYAADVYETLAKKFPETPEFLERLAYLSILADNPKRGLKALDQLEALTGISEITASKKHLIYVALGDNKKAANELRRLADAYPSQLDYRRSLARFYEENGDKVNEKAVWEDILRLNPNDAEARLAVLDKGKGNSEASRVHAMLPLFQDPTVSIDTKIKELSAYLEKLDKNTAPELVTALLDLGAALETIHKDDPKSWSASGDLFYLIDRDAEALERYKRCIQLRPKVFSVWDNALSITFSQKKYDDLMKLSDQAIDAFPNQPKAYYWNGMAAAALQRPTEALTALEQAALMCGSNTGLLMDVTEQIGRTLLSQKKPDAAIARLDKVMPKGGDKHPGVLEVYGDAQAALGNSAKATEWWKKAKSIRSTPELEQKLGY